MHKSRIGCLVIDCQRPVDLKAMGQFWAAALGYTVGEQVHANYLPLVGPAGEVTVLLQAVDHESRVHLDIESDDRPAEVARLEALGAKKIADIQGWTVVEAPSGHRFCVVKPQRPDFSSNAKGWE